MNSREAYRLRLLIREGERYQSALREYSNTGATADISIQQLADWNREARLFLLTQGIDSPDDADTFASTSIGSHVLRRRFGGASACLKK